MVFGNSFDVVWSTCDFCTVEAETGLKAFDRDVVTSLWNVEVILLYSVYCYDKCTFYIKMGQYLAFSRYNLKRKGAELPPITFDLFNKKLIQQNAVGNSFTN